MDRAAASARQRAALLTILGVVIITDVYEGVFVVRTWETDRLRSARLEREKVTAELEALQRGIDPHALFNQRHALMGLIESGSSDATRFAETLAQAYRDMLVVRRCPLVSLDEELRLFSRFLELTEFRSPGVVRVVVAVPQPRDALVPPMVLTVLLQNVVKHNRASAADPLEILIRREGDHPLVDHPLVQGRYRNLRASGCGTWTRACA